MNQHARLGIAFLVISLFVTSCGKEKQTRVFEPIEVEVATVGSKNGQNISDRIGYTGTIAANKKVNLSFQVPGTLEKIPVSMGSFVSKGTLVAEIDETTYRSQYEAQMAQVNLAKENYERISKVFEKGSIAEIKMIEAKSKYQQAQAAAKATYQNIAHTKLHAPISGYVGQKMMEAGDVANPGRPVVQLLDIDVVKAEVPIPDEEINAYQSGDTAIVKIDALGDQEFTGVIDEVAIQSARGNPVYTARVNISNKDRKIKPGMACTIYLPEQDKKPAVAKQIIVPVESVHATQGGHSFVFIAENNKAIKRDVQTGKLYDNGIAITSGLKNGEKLVTSGYHKLTDNTPVTIVE